MHNGQSTVRLFLTAIHPSGPTESGSQIVFPGTQRAASDGVESLRHIPRDISVGAWRIASRGVSIRLAWFSRGCSRSHVATPHRSTSASRQRCSPDLKSGASLSVPEKFREAVAAVCPTLRTQRDGLECTTCEPRRARMKSLTACLDWLILSLKLRYRDSEEL